MDLDNNSLTLFKANSFRAEWVWLECTLDDSLVHVWMSIHSPASHGK